MKLKPKHIKVLDEFRMVAARKIALGMDSPLDRIIIPFTKSA